MSRTDLVAQTLPDDVSVTRPAVVLPPHVVRQEEVLDALTEQFAGVAHLDRGLGLMRHTTVATRNLLIPLDEMLRPRSFGERNQLYTKEAVRLGADAASRALELAGTTAPEIDYLVVVSCTGYMLPGPDAYIAQEIGCRPTMRRTPIQQLGCAAGVTALAEGFHFLQAYPHAQVLVVAVELSSLSFQPEKSSLSDFISAAIFSDGAAAVVMRRGHGDTGFQIRESVQHLLPDSTDVIYGETSQQGFHFMTNPKVRRTVPLVVPELTALVHRQGWELSDLRFCVSHTGGPLVMTGVAEGLGLPDEALAPSRSSLAEIGNPSSVSVFDVLRRHHDAPPGHGSRGLMVAFGPGFTTEALAGVWHQPSDVAVVAADPGEQSTGATVRTSGPAPHSPGREVDLLWSGLVGRDSDLASLRDRLGEPGLRLLTITGPGGVGKSRLAGWLRSGIESADPGSSVALDLADVAATQRLLAVDTTAALIILDHVEHLGDRLPDLVADLLHARADRQVVCVSRSPLHIYGERLFRVAPLSVPVEGMDLARTVSTASVELLVRRAREVDPGFGVTAANRDCVAELCRRLDGLPLALELAAARLSMMTPDALLRRLSSTVDVLQRPPGDTPSRYDNLRASIAASLDRLRPADRSMLYRLAVFIGGFDEVAAQRVAAAVDGTLQALLDEHLLTVLPPADGDTRFVLPHTVRMVALEELGDGDAAREARERHARYYRELVSAAAPALTGSGQDRWLPRLVADRANVTAALETLRETDWCEAAWLATELGPYWSAAGLLRAGDDHLTMVADRGRLAGPLVAQVLTVGGELAIALGDYQRATVHLRRAVTLHDEDVVGVATCLRLLGRAAHGRGELAAARRFLRRALETEAGPWHRAAGQAAMADLCLDSDDPRLARTMAEAAVAAFVSLDDRRSAAQARILLAEVAGRDGSADRAEALCLEALRVFTALGDAISAGQAFTVLATTCALDGRESHLRAARLLGLVRGVRETAEHATQPRRAVALVAVAQRVRDVLGEADFDRELAGAGRFGVSAAGPAPSVSPVDPDNRLTQREAQVAELVALGLTNRQISHQLTIAEWTAVNHVRNVMRKLEVTSRVQVARWVMMNKVAEPDQLAVAT